MSEGQDHKPVRVKDTFNHSLKGPDNVLFYPNGQLFMIYQKLYQIKLFLSSRSGMMNGCPVDQAGRLLAVCTRCNNGCRFWTPFLFCKKESRDRKASVFHLYSYSGALKPHSGFLCFNGRSGPLQAVCAFSSRKM